MLKERRESKEKKCQSMCKEEFSAKKLEKRRERISENRKRKRDYMKKEICHDIET